MDPFSLQNILTWYIKPNLKCRFPNGRQSIKGILLARNIKKHFYVKMVVTIVKRRRAQKKMPSWQENITSALHEQIQLIEGLDGTRENCISRAQFWHRR